MEIGITAIGTATPPYRRSQAEIVELVSTALNLKPSEKRLLKAVYEATGIYYRYSVLSDGYAERGPNTFFPEEPSHPLLSTAARMQIYKDEALPLALKAIHHCFTSLDFNVTDITHLITVSCTGMYAPGLDIEIVRHLQLNSFTKRTCVNFMGCYGIFNALKLADSICKAEFSAKVLVVGVELCTLHFQKNNTRDTIISNAIFADGAAALVVQKRSSQSPAFLLREFHCDLLPQTERAMAWSISDSGFDIILSSYVPQIIESGIAQFSRQLLQKFQMQLGDIDFFAIHPGGIKILQACEKQLQLTKEQNRYSYQVLENYGNMSSVTIAFVLQALWQAIDTQDHGKTIFSCAFGPGLTLESMLLQVCKENS